MIVSNKNIPVRTVMLGLQFLSFDAYSFNYFSLGALSFTDQSGRESSQQMQDYGITSQSFLIAFTGKIIFTLSMLIVLFCLWFPFKLRTCFMKDILIGPWAVKISTFLSNLILFNYPIRIFLEFALNLFISAFIEIDEFTGNS
jgi:hypothetical protein